MPSLIILLPLPLECDGFGMTRYADPPKYLPIPDYPADKTILLPRKILAL
jgi:hypothetical protein